MTTQNTIKHIGIVCMILLTAITRLSYCHTQTEKWAVVTTIHYPTESLKKLAQLPDWHVVIIADKKTPADWHLDGCTFLSVEQQMSLSYKIIPHLPWNHYSRKNIGYLYAIEHGASIIYDTDDDNILIYDTIVYKPQQSALSTYKTNAHLINPYADFGQPDVWPRGYPLTYVNRKTTYELEHSQVRSYIQQGLVNNDPDVDALFRLTRKLPINFDDHDAVSLPIGAMAPFNSQNTLYYYQAFWGLVIPISTAFRVSDIWRGYWVQRMLWDIGGTLCFLPPTAFQERNIHNYFKDFLDELNLYCQSEALVEALLSWKSEKPLLTERICALHSMLVTQGFFKNTELEFIHAWLDDLQTLGYQMPKPVLMQ